ncbi:triosephosphate isomerase, partial [Candidatus Berkelbacteria bacterium]|nr:triosephosphate isomerase [Candidatus Berkelbacteria bacterium]
MFKTIPEAVDFVQKLKPLVAKAEDREVVVAPPFTALSAVAASVKGSNIKVAAQEMHWDKEGAHTGDVSTAMILDAGCSHVIVGHSERRQDHNETDENVNRKVKAA